MDNRAIGVIDSGVGGLTVVKSIRKVLPKESIAYLGDTARVPYGTRSKETIRKFALELVEKILEQNVKALVVACNTVSAIALKSIEAQVAIPVIDVIKPTAEYAFKVSKRDRIGVIGTPATINSKAYEGALSELGKAEVTSKATPLFVPLIEEGYKDHQVMDQMIREYLSSLSGKIDSLILGCTHYPLIHLKIQNFLGEEVQVIDSGLATAIELKQVLETKELLSDSPSFTQVFFTSDDPAKSNGIAREFLGDEVELRQFAV